MNKINVIAGFKGGVGKTTAANHVIPFLTGSKTVFEIDNSNFSSIFSQSEKIEGRTVSTNQKDLETALNDAQFDSFNHNVVVDAGAGDDSKKVIEALKKSNLKCIYWLPLMPDRKGLIPLQKTLEAIGDSAAEINLIFSNFSNLKEDFWFIFGSDDGFEEDLSILENFDFIFEMPKSNVFGKTEFFNTTVWDYSLISQSYQLDEVQAEWVQEGREVFHRNMNIHRRSVDCFEYLQAVQKSARRA
jgi:hypothetical protein